MIDQAKLRHLRALARRYPTEGAALCEMGRLRASLTLPKGTVHVVSDVHGEYKKLEHILRNASGSLRALVDRTFSTTLSEVERTKLLALIYYPREAYEAAAAAIPSEDERRAYLRTAVLRIFVVLRALARRYTLAEVEAIFPAGYEPLFRELVVADALDRGPAFAQALLEPFLAEAALDLLRRAARAVRNLSVAELVVAGDLGDRGPRIDKVIAAIMQQPRVSITWGNHDASWMGACLGQRACVATVVRIAMRYGRLDQLEEGYGIPLEPLEKLARTAYANDPCERFAVKTESLREPILAARMQKAIAILQLKLEAETSRKNPHFGLEHRNLLRAIDPAAGTVTIEGKTYPLLDRSFPTVDFRDPDRLTDDERACIEQLRASFLASTTLWEQMQFVERHGAMWLSRDGHLIFHGCVPVDDAGELLGVVVDGQELRGRALFDGLARVVRRAVRERRDPDVDTLWWLWTGARSPLFGKDKMATFETYFLADKATHKETKNPYFRLIHEVPFCEKICAELGEDPKTCLIVNGHVPVKLEEGESPVKKSGRAVTIDGAFSEAYGDKGYTLVLDCERTYLAQHHHFTSVADAIARGTDIVPAIQEIRRYDPPRTVADTPTGEQTRGAIADLEELVQAYRENALIDARA